jgi:carbon starvation protein
VAAAVALTVLVLFALAYRTYGRFVGDRVYEADRDDDGWVTPAHARSDGRDFVPTPRGVLFGHHFTSIAGAAPIIGPCIAAYWGWVPALVWVVVGTIFMGAVHDFGALVLSAREGGRSVADIAGQVVNGRVRVMFLCFIALLSWLVLAVFAMAIAGLFVAQPSSVLPVNVEILIALGLGLLIHRRRVALFWPSVAALVLLYAFIGVGVWFPIDLRELFGIDAVGAERAWILFLFGYCAVASLLPVWLLLQPRDYINSHQLMVGLGLLYLGLFVARPDFDAPAIRLNGDGAPPVFPLLFVTIACGAISGFHGLVSSGTTSKQLDRMRDARPIGYGGMLGEGTLALASTLAAVAGIALVSSCTLPGQGAVTDLSWAVYYDDWAHAGANKAAAFVLGGGAFLEALGLPEVWARTLMAVLVISFAATTLDTATRITRFILAELGEATGLRPLADPRVGTLLAVGPAVALALTEVPDPVSGAPRAAGWVLWPVFGASNQMLAALTLMVLALYFAARRRPVLPLVIPMAFVMMVTLVALVANLQTFLGQGNGLLVGVTFVLLGLDLWMLAEAARALWGRRR